MIDLISKLQFVLFIIAAAAAAAAVDDGDEGDDNIHLSFDKIFCEAREK